MTASEPSDLRRAAGGAGGGASAAPAARRAWWWRRVRRLGAAVLVLAALVVAVGVLAVSGLHGFFADEEERRFDELETAFREDRAAFAEADARMRTLVAAHPDAGRLGWTRWHVCVGDVLVEGACEDVSPHDSAMFEALPNEAFLVVHQTQDDDSTFFRFFHEEPPMFTVVHASDGTDFHRYADERGFRGVRVLEPGWAILGPIADPERADAQWG